MYSDCKSGRFSFAVLSRISARNPSGISTLPSSNSMRAVSVIESMGYDVITEARTKEAVLSIMSFLLDSEGSPGHGQGLPRPHLSGSPLPYGQTESRSLAGRQNRTALAFQGAGNDHGPFSVGPFAPPRGVAPGRHHRRSESFRQHFIHRFFAPGLRIAGH